MPRRAALREELASLARLALPMAAASAGQALMGLVDTAVCGRAGAGVLAGVGLGNALFMAVAVTGMGLTLGLDPLVAQAIGAGDARAARHLLWQGSWLALAAGVALAIPCAVATLLLGPLGIAPGVATQASRFVLVRLPSLPAFFFFAAARAYLQGLGRTRAVLVTTIAANALNFLLDLLLVFGGGALPVWAGPLRAVPPLGAAGSALATALVTCAQALALAWAVGRVPVPGGAAGLRRPHGPELRRALRVGLPVGLHMGAEVGIFALVGLLAGCLGAVELAAHQVAIALASTSFTFVIGIGGAATVRVGWAIGAGDTPRARRAGLTAFAAGAAVMATSGLAFALLRHALARLMSDDPAVVAAAGRLLLVAAVFQLSDGVQGVGAGVLRGAGDTRYCFAANVAGHWLLGLPVAVALGLLGGLGVTGLWWGLCVGLSAVGAALLLRFLRLSSRPMAPLAQRGAEAPPCASS